jgi:hypothetical protein
MKYTHKHFYPPTLVTISSQKYIVPGWVSVPTDTTLSDIIHEKLERAIPTTYEVVGSKGDKYTVTVSSSRTTCDCPGGKFHGKCKHITEIISKIVA